MFCDNGQAQIRTTCTVDEILCSLRELAKKLYLWVDAIYLNKSDDEEKRVQMPRMADLYRLARKVHICLHNVPRPLILFNLIRRIKADRERWDSCSATRPDIFDEDILDKERVMSVEKKFYKPVDYMLSREVWLALVECKEDVFAILSHPFWCCRWIVQEVLLGQVLSCAAAIMPCRMKFSHLHFAACTSFLSMVAILRLH
jgi:hypothetical protein